jgi:hypothetical protein
VKGRYIIIVVGLVITIIAATLSFNYPREDFSVYNSQWNGASDLPTLVQNEHPSSVIFSEHDLNSKDHGVVFLLNPDKGVSFSQEDITSISSFVAGGGSLVIANDFGNANQLLNGLHIDSAARFSGSLLYDDYNNWAGAAWPTISTFSNSSMTTGIGNLSFNYATTLNIGPPVNGSANGASGSGVGNVTVLATSAPLSYLDAASRANDTRSKKPVLVSLTYGNGRIILLSDPSVFVNGMLGEGDNQRLFQNIIANLTNGDPQTPVFFDESHRVQQPFLTKAYLRVNNDETLKYVAVLAAIGTFAAVLTATRINRGRRKGIDVSQLKLTDKAMLADVAKRHPEWSSTQITKLLRGTRGGKKKE